MGQNLNRMLGCIHAVLFAGVNTQWTNVHGLDQRAVELIRQHTAPPPQPAAATPAAPPDAGEPAVSSPAPLPAEIFKSAGHGELQKVVKWLRKGGPVDALCPTPFGPRGPVSGSGRLWPEPNGSGRRGSAATGSGASL